MILSQLKSDATSEIMTGYPKEVRQSISKAIRKGLVMMERHHKKQEIRRGAGKAAAVADRWSWRTGALAKSYRIYMKKGDLVGYYGSNQKYARILEEGGTIRPKRGKYLAIPLDAAKYGVGGSVTARHHKDLFAVRSKKGTLILDKAAKAGITPMFVLKKKVKLDPRKTIERTEKANLDKVNDLVADAAVKPLEGK